MDTLLPQFGLVIMFSYALFNLYNILLLRLDLSFTTVWLLSAGIVYFIQRIHRFAQNGQGATQSELTGLILVALSFAAIALQYLNLREFVGESGVMALRNMRTEWALSMLWLFAGGAVATFNVKESPTIALIVLALTGLAFLSGLDDQMMVSYREVIEVGVVEEINHLYLEKHVVFLLILAYCLSPRTKWLVAIAGILLLYSTGGRTSLFVFTACVVWINVGKRSLGNLFVLGIIGILVFFSLRYAVVNQFIDIDNARVSSMLFIGGVEEDNSYQARVQLLKMNLQFLDDQFMYGDPTIFPQKLRESGTYIHNILSVWQFYGFFVFACVALILLFSLRRMFVLKSVTPTPKIIFGSFLLMYVTLGVLLAKSATWDLLWFALGFWTLLPVTKIKRRRRRQLSRRRHVRPTEYA